jgi:putative flippase GtrA
MLRSSAPRAADTLSRTRGALGRPQNWLQLARFCAVGASGFAVNLAVYALLLRGAGLHYLLAATGSFLVAVTSNYTWNRLWTFRRSRGHVGYQGLRFLIVSTSALIANLLVLSLLVELGVGKLLAQATAIVLVTPLNFVGNKLWSFGR